MTTESPSPTDNPPTKTDEAHDERRDAEALRLTEGAASTYLTWNDAIASRFFNRDRAGQPVYLFVTREVIAEAGQRLDQSLDDYLAAVRAGPPGATRSGHCQRALQIADGWRDRGLRYPPYIAYLALFVLAAGHEGDFDPRSYYPRLWALLGESEFGTPPSFHRMLELWDDLEKWSVQDRQGELGLYEANIVGGKIHIGLPLAQTVLTEAERHALPIIFAAAGLEPGTVPTGRELRRALTVQGRSALRRQTIAAVDRSGDSFAEAVLEIASDEFLEWDGRLPPSFNRPDRATPLISAGLRLCLSIDRVARSATVTLRCHSKRELPHDGLILAGAAAGDLACAAYLPQWSGPLSARGVETLFAPDPAAWDEGLTLSDSRLGWTLRLRPGSVRVFVEGGPMQLPGLIEILEIPRLVPFYIAFDPQAQAAMDAWVHSDCDGWQEIRLGPALPAGWTFGSVKAARSDHGPRQADDALGFPDRRTLQLIGGIRAGAGNTFFAFAPPRLLLTGAMSGDAVVCNGHRLGDGSSGEQVYDMPVGLPVDTRIGLEVKQGEEVLKRRSLYLVSGAAWHLDAPLVARDEYGTVMDGGTIAGAQAPDPPKQFEHDLLRTPGLDAHAPRVYFIGQIAGQISAWPAEPLPLWKPVWAVPLGRRGKALYCGTSIASEAPRQRALPDRDRLSMWRDILWHRRARITPPRDAALRSLWQQYVESARA